MNRTDVEFRVADATVLRGWWYSPDAPPPWPAVVVTHGFGIPKEMQLPAFAEAFVAAGLAVLVYDHRNLGASDGEPRQEIDPYAQVADARDAITWVSARDDVAAGRIGVWGTSYSGGHALVLGATDRRLRCVVSQVPTISGRRNTQRRFPGDALQDLRRRLAADRLARHRGDEPGRVPQVTDLHPDDLAGATDRTADTALGNDLRAWIAANDSSAVAGFRNDITLRSLELYAAYEPGVHIAAVAPTPLLVICLHDDPITPADETLGAYEQAREPKRLLILQGGHCDVYGIHRDEAARAARDWFLQHLG